MIYIDKKEVIALYREGKTIQATYKGMYLIWQSIRSCFGSGAWVNEKPWLNEEGWKNK
jgi:hypothetical protein